LLQAEKTFTRVLGTPARITAVHAGLECGVIKGIIPAMRMISFGPDILDAHTILERVLLKSVRPFYKCLTALLQDLCVQGIVAGT
jgi:dipeptidase D